MTKCEKIKKFVMDYKYPIAIALGVVVLVIFGLIFFPAVMKAAAILVGTLVGGLAAIIAGVIVVAMLLFVVTGGK